MKTLRTVFATAAVIFLAFFGLCFLFLYLDGDILQRTVFYLFQRTRYVLLILGASSLLICIIVSLALRKDDGEEDEDEEEDDPFFGEDEKEPVRYSKRTPNPVPEKRKRPAEPVKNVNRRPKTEKKEDRFNFDDYVSIGAEYVPEVKKEAPAAAAFCPNCGAAVSKNSIFCELCGNKIV